MLSKLHFLPSTRSRYSDWLRAGRPGGRNSSPGRVKDYSLLNVVQTGSEAQPASYPMDTGTLSPGVRRPGRETDHSPPTSAKVKKNVDLYIHSPIRFYDLVFN
jgi:hypothetical protein